MDFIKPNPLCCHLTRHSSLNTLSFHNNSTALALVSVAWAYTHIHIHTPLTAGSELWFCQRSLPQCSEQYLNHHTVKWNLMELAHTHVRAHILIHTYTPLSPTGYSQSVSDSFHWSHCCMFGERIWPVISSVIQWHKRYEESSAVPSMLLHTEDWEPCYILKNDAL